MVVITIAVGRQKERIKYDEERRERERVCVEGERRMRDMQLTS